MAQNRLGQKRRRPERTSPSAPGRRSAAPAAPASLAPPLRSPSGSPNPAGAANTPGIGEEAQQFVHAATRSRASASITRAGSTLSMPPAATISEVRHGPQIAGSDDPKITTTGMPKAAAMCAGPESLPTNSADPPSSSLTSFSGAPEISDTRETEPDHPPPPPMKTGSIPDEQILGHRHKPVRPPALAGPPRTG